MVNIKIYTAGKSSAINFAIDALKSKGYAVTHRPENATHLLLPVPSFDPDGSIKGGQDLSALLSMLPDDITVIGGNLNRPELADYKTTDLLKDPYYLAENAGITAHCAVKLAMDRLPVTLDRCPVLVIGWGRIGKCLSALLQQIGANVTVAARKEADRAMITALRFRAVDTAPMDTGKYRVIFNTVPEMVSCDCPGTGLKIDLASKPGLGSMDVLWARGLPGKEVPESSGMLIADTVDRLISGKESIG